MVSWRRLAPMIATLRTSKNRSIDARLGPVLARPHHADRGVGRLDRELQLHHAVGEAARRPW